MKKILMIIGLLVVSAVLAGLAVKLPSIIRSNTKSKEAKIMAMDSNIFSAKDKALGAAIEDLKEVKEFFSGNGAVIKKAEKMLVEAKKLRKILKEAKDNEQKLQVFGKIKEFSVRFNELMEHCNRVYLEIERGRNNKKSVKDEVKGVKEI